MTRTFGPWATAINTGSNPQLSRFWRRRLTQLPAVSQSRNATAWTMRAVVAAATVVLLGVPTLRDLAVSAEEKEKGIPSNPGTAAKPRGIARSAKEPAANPPAVDQAPAGDAKTVESSTFGVRPAIRADGSAEAARAATGTGLSAAAKAPSAGPQLLVHVRALELDRTRLRAAGFDIGEAGVSGLLITPKADGKDPRAARLQLLDPGSRFFEVLRTVQKDGLAKVLAEPTLVVPSGRPCSFFCGGEFPVKVPKAGGGESVDYKKFGTSVDVLPILTPDKRVRLELRVSVSELDLAHSMTVDGQTLPGIHTREVETGAELKLGQTLLVSGLIQVRKAEEPSTADKLLALLRQSLAQAGQTPPALPPAGTSDPTSATTKAPPAPANATDQETEVLVLVTPELAETLSATTASASDKAAPRAADRPVNR